MVMLWIKMWIEFQGRLPMYLLVGGSGPNVVHACKFFFLNEYKTCLPEVKKIWRFQSCVSKDQRFGILAHVFRGSRIFGVLAHVFRGPKFLDPGSYFQRTQDIWILAHVFRGPEVLDPSSCFQRTQDFWILALVFREPRVFQALAHVFR